MCLETFLAVTACGVAPQASSGWRPGLLHLQPPAPWEAPQHRVLLSNSSTTLRNPPLTAPGGDGLQRNEHREDQETVLLRPARVPLSQSSTGSKVRLHCSALVSILEWDPLPTLTLHSPHALSHEASILRHTWSLRCAS